MTHVQNGSDPQLHHVHHDVPQDIRPEQPAGAGGSRTLLLLGLLAITGAAWWTLQDRDDAIANAPSLTSAEPLPAPIDEAVIEPAARAASTKPAAKTATPGRNRDAALIASS